MNDEHDEPTEWPTPETGTVAGMFKEHYPWQRAAIGVADLYARQPALCDDTRGHYPPRFAWWVERWVRDQLTKWKGDCTPTQKARRALVVDALARVDWDALADALAARAARRRERIGMDNKPAAPA